MPAPAYPPPASRPVASNVVAPVLPGPIDRLHERLFVGGYAAIQRRSERAGMREIRRGLVADAHGTVLEIGAGTGLNLSHYGPAVDELLLVEPAPAMRAALRRAAGDRGTEGDPRTMGDRRADGDPGTEGERGTDDPPRVRIVDGTGERLPADDGSVDVVVATFVLCSVADPAAVVREAVRVLRPGGLYLGLEHVLGDQPVLARAQHLVAPAWRFAARGCRCDQDAEALLRSSPLSVERAAAFRGPRQPWPVRPGVRLVARRA